MAKNGHSHCDDISSTGIWKSLPHDLDTKCVVGGYDSQLFNGKCVIVPIVTSGVFDMDGVACDHPKEKDLDHRPYRHSRKGNPTRDALEKHLAEIEGSKFALTFASGCAAMNNVMQALLNGGDHVVGMQNIYGGSTMLLRDFRRFGVHVDLEPFVDANKLAAKVKPNTRMLWVETPTNPTMEVVDIRKVVNLSREINPDIIVVVDNTFLTPVLQRPLDLGADISLYSCSKYLGGHIDLVMGSIALNSDSLFVKLRTFQEMTGGVPSPHDCYMLIRSLKTLPLRMKQHAESAMKIAEFLQGHSRVLKVVHPGLKSHAQHDIAKCQQLGHSGVIAFYLDGDMSVSTSFLMRLKLIHKAHSLGADISIANIPAKLSHIHVPADELLQLGITDNLIRLSVGLESTESLIQDLKQALE